MNSYTESNTFLYEWVRPDLRQAGADQAVATKFADGWYPQETAPTGPFRWMSPLGKINVASSRAGTLVIHARMRSIVPDNSVAVLVDDQPAASQSLPGAGWQECLLRVPLTAGAHTLLLRSGLPGVQPPGDNRTLTVCVTGFEAHVE